MSTWEKYLQRGWSILRIYGIDNAVTPVSCRCGDPECRSPGKHSPEAWARYQTTHVTPKLAAIWFRDPRNNIAIVTGRISNLVVIDEDEAGAADSLHLPPTLTVSTHHGRKHYYFLHPHLDRPFPNVLGFIPHVDIKGDGGYVVAPPSRHASGDLYSWIDESVPIAPFPQHLLSMIPTPTDTPTSEPVNDDEWDRDIPQGERDVTLTRLAGSLLGRGMAKEEVYRRISDHNQQHVKPPLPDADIRKIVFGIATNEAKKKSQSEGIEDSISLFRDGQPPKGLEAPAYYGLVGDILRAVDPYSEPCHASILVSFLTAFGNKIGRQPCSIVGAQTHHANLFALIFGESGLSRKGMSWAIVDQLLQTPLLNPPTNPRIVDFSSPESGWRVSQGISSGEGMIYLVRDARPAVGKIPEDPGVIDKRKLFVETEFGAVIRKAKHESSILWQILRTFFDGGRVENNPRHEQLTATDAHISIIGHITPSELRSTFPSAERTTGTANRFLWIYADRNHSLPDGDPIPASILVPLQQRIAETIDFATRVTIMTRDEEASEYWRYLYTHELAEDERGPLRDLLSRGKPIVLRLSMIYALLDKSSTICKRHLDSALAIWHYSKESIAYLYGTNTGSPLGNRITNFLAEQNFCTRTKLFKAIPGYTARDFDAMLDQLKQQGFVEEFQPERRAGQKGPVPVFYRLTKISS